MTQAHSIDGFAKAPGLAANGSPAQRKISGFGQLVLVPQGGGAIGAYQAGVYQAMHEAGIEHHTKDIDFSRKGIRARWAAGYGNARRELADAPWEAAVDPIEGFYLHECRPATASIGERPGVTGIPHIACGGGSPKIWRSSRLSIRHDSGKARRTGVHRHG